MDEAISEDEVVEFDPVIYWEIKEKCDSFNRNCLTMILMIGFVAVIVGLLILHLPVP